MNPWLRQLNRVPLLETPPKPEKQKVPDTNDARIAELRKRYKKVQDEPGAPGQKSETDLNWF